MVNTMGQCWSWARLPASRRSRDKVTNFHQGRNRDFSAFRFSLQLMLEQALTNLIVCLMISHKKYIQMLHKRDSMLQWILGRFGITQNLFEMKLAKNRFD